MTTHKKFKSSCDYNYDYDYIEKIVREAEKEHQQGKTKLLKSVDELDE